MNPVPLQRSSETVTAFLSCLGNLRETRLTATLGYLVSRFPDQFLPLIAGKKARITSVLVEETEEGNRYDVLLRDEHRPIIIEAKLGLQQNPSQLLRYVKKVRKTYGRPKLVIVDVGSGKGQTWRDEYTSIKSLADGPHFVTWTQIAGVCRRITHLKKSYSQDRIAAAVAEDLVKHMEENDMITDQKPEIYLRDVSTPDSVKLYFKHNIYKCQPQFLPSARGNHYFAPYFTRHTAQLISRDNLVPIGEGISYISSIKDVQVMPTRDVRDFLKSKDIIDYKKATQLMRSYRGGREILLILLGMPYRLFMTPVTKAKLTGFGTGMMGSRSCTLEELLAAAQT